MTEAQLVAFALDLGVNLAEKWLSHASANRAESEVALRVQDEKARKAGLLP